MNTDFLQKSLNGLNWLTTFHQKIYHQSFSQKKFMVKSKFNITIYVETNSVDNDMDEINYYVEQIFVLFHDEKMDVLILLDFNLMNIHNIFGRDIFKKQHISSLDKLLLSKEWKILKRDEIRGIEIKYLYEWNKQYESGIFFQEIYRVLNCDEDIFDRDRALNACRIYIRLIKKTKIKGNISSFI